MKITFKDEALSELYETGKTANTSNCARTRNLWMATSEL